MNKSSALLLCRSLIISPFLRTFLNFNFNFQILSDQVSFSVSTGARTSHLFTVEWYNTNIVLTPLNPCLDVNSVTVEASGNQILVKQSIYHNTVKVSALLRAQGIIRHFFVQRSV